MQGRSSWLVPAVIAAAILVVALGSVAFAGMHDDSEVAYPDRPSNLSAENALSFVSEYERAYARNDLSNRYASVRDVEFRVTDSAILNRTDDGVMVRLRVFLSWKRGESVADRPYAVNYFVNESVLIRSEFPRATSPGPDPRRNGTVVERSP